MKWIRPITDIEFVIKPPGDFSYLLSNKNISIYFSLIITHLSNGVVLYYCNDWLAPDDWLFVQLLIFVSPIYYGDSYLYEISQ